jgi:uncharacterized protein (TIGR03790 family)
MSFVRLRSVGFAGILLGWNWFACFSWAGGSGLNTLVVINQNSSNSIALGNYYSERRQIPPENVLRIAWSGGNISWNADQFHTNLLQPLLQAIATRGLSNQIHYVVLSMDIPYSSVADTFYNGTTSALFYGLRSNSAPSLQMLTNSYFAKEADYPDAKPAATFGYSFLTTMITANTLAQAKLIVDHGVDSDGTFPTAPVHLAKSSDPLRRIRYTSYDNVVFNTRLRGNYLVVRTNSSSPFGLSGLLGYQTGLMNYSISPNTFVPGAMADSLTSYGGVIFGNNDQTSLLGFLNAGAAGSYGTVTEPTANTAKFPNPQNYFYQARGFTLAECYYQSLSLPYQGLIVGEPLAAPFAQPAEGGWLNAAPGDVLTGTRPLSVQFTAADATRPLQRVDLFVDGKFLQTLTNLAPASGNLVKMRINGQNLSYTVPANATLGAIATGIAAMLNAPAITNLTKTIAQAFGDRVELRYFATNRPAPPYNLHVTTPDTSPFPLSEGPVFATEIGTAGTRNIFLSGAKPTFLESSAFGTRAGTISGTVQAGTWLRLTVTKTNGAVVIVGFTNQLVGASPALVLSNLVNQINAEASLQGPEGLIAEDFTTGVGLPNCNLTARSPGPRAANLKVMFSSSGSLVGNPATATALNANQTDLQPRNHLYLTTGTDELTANFSLNTTSLPDGYHELTAVAYEGSHVRTQTRVALPVRIQNTPLTASLTLQNLAATNSVSGTYSIQVTASTNNIASITLYSTGGGLGTVANQATATFAISGPTLGIGAHPFYAMVQDQLGRRYRTETQTVRFTSP